MADGNGNGGTLERVLDKKELARQRKVFLRREQRHAEKALREKETAIMNGNGSAVECDVEADNVRKRKRNEEQNKRYDAEKRRADYTANKQREKIDEDAQRFRNYVDGYLVFEVCCICAFEGSVVDFVPLDDVMDLLEKTKYVKSFVDYCNKLSRGNSQDKSFFVGDSI
jgi:hypothetical protein